MEHCSEVLAMKTPFTAVVSGVTGAGKSHLLHQMLENADYMFTPKITKIIYAYGVFQPIFLDLQSRVPNMTLNEGFPDEVFEQQGENENTLLILDDLIEMADDKRLLTLFTRMRHRNISTMFVTQNLFFNGKFMRSINKNSHYTIVFPSPRDTLSLEILGRQIFPDHPKFLAAVHRMQAADKDRYIFLDLRPGSDEKCRVRTRILPGENPIIYRPA